jgi:lipopolysaccharide transport system permease protein
MLNPMVGIVEGFRNVLIKGAAPPLEPLAVSVVITGVLVAVCWPMFRKLSEYFADVL